MNWNGCGRKRISVLSYYSDIFVDGLRKTTAIFRMSLALRGPDSVVCTVATLRTGCLRKRDSIPSRDKTFISYFKIPDWLLDRIYLLSSG